MRVLQILSALFVPSFFVGCGVGSDKCKLPSTKEEDGKLFACEKPKVTEPADWEPVPLSCNREGYALTPFARSGGMYYGCMNLGGDSLADFQLKQYKAGWQFSVCAEVQIDKWIRLEQVGKDYGIAVKCTDENPRAVSHYHLTRFFDGIHESGEKVVSLKTSPSTLDQLTIWTCRRGQRLEISADRDAVACVGRDSLRAEVYAAASRELEKSGLGEPEPRAIVKATDNALLLADNETQY